MGEFESPPHQYVDHDTGTIVLDPVRHRRILVPGLDPEHLEQDELQKRQYAQRVSELKPLVEQQYRKEYGRTTYLPSLSDIPRHFQKKTNEGSRRYDGLPHRSDEWDNYRGGRQNNGRVGELPAIVQYAHDAPVGMSKGDIERAAYKERIAVSERVFEGVPLR